MLDGLGDIALLTASNRGVEINLHVDDFTFSAAGSSCAEVCEAAQEVLGSFRSFVLDELEGAF